MSTSPVRMSVQDGVCTLQLHQLDVKNALNAPMLQALEYAFTAISEDATIRVIIVTGTDKVFSAGGDVRSFKEVDIMSVYKRLERAQTLIQKMLSCPKPIIAAVNGVAAGAGVSLVFACDIVIATEDASFIQSFAKIGAVPDLGAATMLPALIGRHYAMEWMLLGKRIYAPQAKEWRLINEITTTQQLQARVQAVAQQLANGPQLALYLTKKMINQPIIAQLQQGFELERFAQATCMQSDDFSEGVQAFLQKRAADFQ